MMPAPPEAISGRGKLHALFQLLEVVTVTHAVLIHHVEDDFSGSTFCTSCTQSSVSH